MTREEKAVYYKHNGFNCCQSVIKAMIDLSDSDKEILTKAASGFAVGMGGMEATLDFAKWFDYGTDAKGRKRAEGNNSLWVFFYSSKIENYICSIL